MRILKVIASGVVIGSIVLAGFGAKELAYTTGTVKGLSDNIKGIYSDINNISNALVGQQEFNEKVVEVIMKEDARIQALEAEVKQLKGK